MLKPGLKEVFYWEASQVLGQLSFLTEGRLDESVRRRAARLAADLANSAAVMEFWVAEALALEFQELLLHDGSGAGLKACLEALNDALDRPTGCSPASLQRALRWARRPVLRRHSLSFPRPA